MKKLLITILLMTSPAFAYENYMIISDVPIKSVYVENDKILDAKPVFTISNEKKILILTPKNTGKTKIFVDLNENSKILDVDVTKKITKIKPEKGFDYFAIDEPPKGIELLPPPGRM